MNKFIMVLVSLVLSLICIVGYISNIVDVAHSAGFSGMLVLRVLGIFCPPLGVILGYI